MKTLFKRLKPEVLERLEIERQVFPSTINDLYIDLQNNNNWLDLKYQFICILKVHLDLEDYSPSKIDELFNEPDLMTILEQIDKKYLQAFEDLPESDIKKETFEAISNEKRFGNLETKYADYLCENLLGTKEAFLLDLLPMQDLNSSNNKTSKGEAGINIKSGWSL
jgi:hypothetical protein